MSVCYFTKNQKTNTKYYKKKKKKTPKDETKKKNTERRRCTCLCMCVFLCSWNVNSILYCIKEQGNVQSNGYCNVFLCF